MKSFHLLVCLLSVSFADDKRLLVDSPDVQTHLHEIDVKLQTLTSQLSHKDSKITELENAYRDMSTQLVEKDKEISSLQGLTGRMNKLLTIKDQQITGIKSQITFLETAGVTYKRWGSPTCNSGSQLLYTGYMSGKKHNINGGGGNYLCLTTKPEYSNLNSPNVAHSLYGVETDINGFSPDIANKEATCAVCFTSKKSSVLMIPGKKSCPSGWNIEYWGYLMSDAVNGPEQPTEYVCVDNHPTPVSNRVVDDGEGVLWLVGGMCGSLKCPPYVNGKALTCVVCSI